jgi:hypothetical protein
MVTIKDLQTRSQVTVPQTEIVKQLLEMLAEQPSV